jgi:hypothetical protein
MNEICMLSYYQKLEYFFVRRDFSIGRATNLRRNHFTLSVSASVYIPPVFCALRCLMTDGSIQLRAQPSKRNPKSLASFRDPPKDFSYARCEIPRPAALASFRACCHAQPSKRNPKSLSQNKNDRIQRQALAVKFPQILNLSPNPSPPPSSRLALCSIFRRHRGTEHRPRRMHFLTHRLFPILVPVQS